MSCDEVVDRLPALVAGDLTTTEENAIDHHISDCRSCHHDVQECRDLSAVIDTYYTPAESTADAESLSTMLDSIHESAQRLAFIGIRPSPIGDLGYVVTDQGLAALQFRADLTMVQTWAEQHGLIPLEDDAELEQYVREVNEYLAGDRQSFDFAVDLRSVTPFARSVLEEALRIPYGQIRRYVDIAREIGNPRANRAVGTALGGNPIPVVIPCHRVIRSDGGLGGYTGGLDIKQQLLMIEGSLLNSA